MTSTLTSAESDVPLHEDIGEAIRIGSGVIVEGGGQRCKLGHATLGEMIEISWEELLVYVAPTAHFLVEL